MGQQIDNKRWLSLLVTQPSRLLIKEWYQNLSALVNRFRARMAHHSVHPICRSKKGRKQRKQNYKSLYNLFHPTKYSPYITASQPPHRRPDWLVRQRRPQVRKARPLSPASGSAAASAASWDAARDPYSPPLGCGRSPPMLRGKPSRQAPHRSRRRGGQWNTFSHLIVWN